MRSPWLKIHQSLRDDPRLFELMNRTGWSRPEAIGRLYLLYLWAIDHREDGNLAGVLSVMVAIVMDLTREHASRIMDDLEASGFLTSDGRLTQWDEPRTGVAVDLLRIRGKGRKSGDSPDEVRTKSAKRRGEERRGKERIISDPEGSSPVEPTGPAAQRTPPHSEILGAWNALGCVPHVQAWSAKRQAAWVARSRDSYFRANWRGALAKIPVSDFLTGQNDRGWVANLDWFLRPGTVLSLMEGKYNGKHEESEEERQARIVKMAGEFSLKPVAR